MSPKIFEEMILAVFDTKREFSAFTGISVAQVQRYTSGVSPIPRSVALLVAAMATLKRRQIPMPDLAELGGPPEHLEFDHMKQPSYAERMMRIREADGDEDEREGAPPRSPGGRGRRG